VSVLRWFKNNTPASDASALAGVWHLLTSAPEEQAELEIHPDGRMTYAIREGDAWQVMKLTYRVEGHVIVSNQPSAPREDRTNYSLEPDGSLVLDLRGERSIYRRGERRVPIHDGFQQVGTPPA
jgi:hypothetical protein